MNAAAQAALLARLSPAALSQVMTLAFDLAGPDAATCSFSGPGVYRLRESQRSDRTALYHVDEVMEHPSGPFIMCRSTDPEIRLPISFQGPFEAWAVERVDMGGAAP